MQNFLNKAATFFIRMFRPVLFLLIGIRGWQYSRGASYGDITFPVTNLLLHSLGWIFFCAWVYAIGYIANKKLQNHVVHLPIAKYFNLSILAVVATYLLMIYFATPLDVPNHRFSILYYQPQAYAWVFSIAMFFAIGIAAKLLVSAEKVSGLPKRYINGTFLLMVIAPIGLWWIQPRAQKLLSR
ncbi:MAG: hypothetical protein ABIO46_07455 [Chitinophagales bacterium]